MIAHAFAIELPPAHPLLFVIKAINNAIAPNKKIVAIKRRNIFTIILQNNSIIFEWTFLTNLIYKYPSEGAWNYLKGL